MNNDLISRSEVEKLGVTCLARRNENGQLEAIISLDNAPTVEIDKLILILAKRSGKREMMLNALRPKGEWIMDNEHTKNPLLWYKCNLCGVYHSPTNFCPSCGADMRGKEE